MLASMLVLARTPVQDLSEAAPFPHDRVVEVVLDEQDSTLPGHGACEWIEHEARFSGTLHVWTKADGGLDTLLQVEDPGLGLLAEDEDSGGRPTPYLSLEVEAGQVRVIAVAASVSGGKGRVELHLVAAPETETTRTEAERARLEIAAIAELRVAHQLAKARERTEALVEHLLSVDGGERSEAITRWMWALGLESETLRLLRPGERALQAVLAHRTHTLPDDHPHLQRARERLAMTAHVLGDVWLARTLFEKALEVQSRTLPEDHPHLQGTRHNLAIMLQDFGDLVGAQALQEKALEVYERTLPPDHPNLQYARQNLAITLEARGDLTGSRALQEKVLEFFERTLPDDDVELQRIRGSLAITLQALGDLTRSRALQEKVQEVYERKLPDDYPDLQAERANLAVTVARQARGSGGGGEQEKDFVGLVDDYARSLRRSAFQSVLVSSGRESEERVASGKTVDRLLSLARGFGVFPSNPRLEEAAFLCSESTRNFATVSARLARAARSDPVWAELHEEMRRATDRLAELGQAGGSAESFADARMELDRVQRELARLGGRLLPGALAALEADVASLSSRLGERDALVGYRRYELTELDGSRETSTQSLCAFVLRSGARLRRVELGPIEPIERAVEQWRAAVCAGPGPSRGIEVESIAQDDATAIGEAVRRLVFDPLRQALEGADRIVVAPDDVLHLVPLDALPAGEETAGAPDGARRDPRTAPKSAGLLLGDVLRIEMRANVLEALEEARPATPGGSLVVIGDVDYLKAIDLGEARAVEAGARIADPTARAADHAGVLRGGPWEKGFEPLPGTGVEARGVAALRDASIGGETTVELLLGARASREILSALAPRARFLHVATHGWFAPESIRSTADPDPLDPGSGFVRRMELEERVMGMSPMLLCGLALAGASLPANELGRIPGLLTAEEIAGLDLAGCELAVLSACDTNVGLRRAGQGVASLQKALHMAGAHSVITSLWKVPDQATKELMLGFYRRLWVERKPKHQALWEAKKELREARDEGGRAKYSFRDWAGWVLSGEQH